MKLAQSFRQGWTCLLCTSISLFILGEYLYAVFSGADEITYTDCLPFVVAFSIAFFLHTFVIDLKPGKGLRFYLLWCGAGLLLNIAYSPLSEHFFETRGYTQIEGKDTSYGAFVFLEKITTAGN